MIYFYIKINFLGVWILLEETDDTTAIHECESSIETSMQKVQKSRNSLSKDINCVQRKDFDYLTET